jgi:signal transduction histidine kinase
VANDTSGTASVHGAAWVQGGGEAGALIRSIDWRHHPLGAIENWPQSLRTVVSVCLASRFPIVLWWGRDLFKLYNDAYSAMLGDKHPRAMGQSGRECWAEIWHIIGPMLDGVMTRGEATWSDNQMLPLRRHGFTEECYFTYTYSPIRDESGGVGGVFCAVIETTERVIASRRLAALRELAAHAAAATDVARSCRMAVDALQGNAADVPFATVYLRDEDGRLAPTAAAGVAPGAQAAAEHAIQRVAASRTGEVLSPLPRALAASGGPWPEPAHTALVLPIATSEQEHPYGVLVAGVSPRRPLDAAYRSFLELVATQMGTGIANARRHEDERRRAEMLAEIDRAKTVFFSNVSHEFRTPLTLMLGPIADLQARATSTLEQEQLATLHRNALRLLKLVNTLLDFSRIESGRAHARYRPTDLATLTRELASLFRSAIERAGLRLTVQADALPEPVYVDRDMWEKIVLNLVSNAFKFTLEGEITVALRDENGSARLSVTDTGVGIPADAVPHIFDRFHRVEGTRGRSQEGSGIGLALVQELVRLHHGVITASSTEGRGTTFTVTVPFGRAHLPAGQVDDSTTNAEISGAHLFLAEANRWIDADTAPSGEVRAGASAVTGTDELHGARVLVADDNADMRDYLARLLRDRYEVDVVSNGAKALEVIRANPPDLLISDVMMPGLDGFALLRRIREDPSTAALPVVLLSARAGEESRLDGLSRGADDYLVKPFSAHDLRARVEIQLLRARLRAAADAERRRLQEVFRHAPAPIAIVRGPDHVFELANPAYLALFGGRDIVGRPARAALPELEGQGVIELLDRVYRTGEPHHGRSLRLSVVQADGRPPQDTYFDFVYQPIRNDAGDVQGIAAVVFDVTALATAKRDAEAANRAKDEFLAMLGHELRNPLAPIQTALQLMNLRGDETALRERAVIERQVRHLVRLVDDLLDVSRIARGKIELRRQPVEISEVLARAIEMASPLLEERRHNLSVDVPQRGLTVLGDLTRLAQVVMNLLTNAAKYTEPGGRIVLSAAHRHENIEVRVKDSGIGISAEMLPKVFELFAQESQSLDRSRGGLGLGLTIVRSLVELHGGSVEAHSAGPGLGSDFVIRLPALAASRSAGADADAGDSASARASLRVLVVDDNRDGAELIAEALEIGGHTPRIAFDGPSALDAAAVFEPDVALLDLGLPVMDGYELAERLQSRATGAPMVVIAITGYGQEADRQRSESCGFRAHLVKPIDLDALQRLLQQIAAEHLGTSTQAPSAPAPPAPEHP